MSIFINNMFYWQTLIMIMTNFIRDWSKGRQKYNPCTFNLLKQTSYKIQILKTYQLLTMFLCGYCWAQLAIMSSSWILKRHLFINLTHLNFWSQAQILCFIFFQCVTLPRWARDRAQLNFQPMLAWHGNNIITSWLE